MSNCIYKFYALFLISCVLSFNLHAQSIIRIDSVEVDAARSGVKFPEAARNVIIIDKNVIEASAATSINEILEFAASVDVRQRGQQGVQADLSLRGSSFEQVLVLLNGIKMTDPQTGHHALNLPIDLLDIERIEILHGGAARIYGPGAFAGSINIITKNPNISQAKIQLMAGENGLRQAGISASVVEENHSHTLSYMNRKSDGFVENTDYQLDNLYWQSELNLKNTSFQFNAGQNTKEFGAQNFYTVNFPNQYEATKAQFTSLAANVELENLTISPQAYYRKHTDRFELLRESPDFYHRLVDGGFANNFGDTIGFYNGHNYHQTDVYGAEINLTYQSVLGKTSLGYDYRKEDILSNNLGKDMSSSIKVKNENENAFYTKSDSRENSSIYAEQTYSSNKLFVSAGVLYNTNSKFDEDFYPGIDAAFQLNSDYRIYGSVNKSFRFPSFTDLYYNLGGATGSINLKPEESVNYELGLKLNESNGFGHVSLFRREGKNLIDWVRLNGSANTVATNLTEVVIEGAEIDYSTKPSGWVKEVKFLNQIKFSYTYMTSDNNSDGFESNYVLDFLQHKADLFFQLKLTETVNFNWSTSFQERKGEFVDANREAQKYEAIYLSDAKLTFQQKDLLLFLQVTNVFNQEYFDLGNVQNPGRWVSAGLNYKIDFKK